MYRNNKGFSSGLVLAVILLVVVIVALLFIVQMGGLGMGKAGNDPAAQTPDPVAQAQEAVDAVNEHLQQYGNYGEP
jgi:hypothetical protein